MLHRRLDVACYLTLGRLHNLYVYIRLQEKKNQHRSANVLHNQDLSDKSETASYPYIGIDPQCSPPGATNQFVRSPFAFRAMTARD